jgi:hypothetical protein
MSEEIDLCPDTIGDTVKTSCSLPMGHDGPHKSGLFMWGGVTFYMNFIEPCVCHKGSVCSEACSRGMHHDGCVGHRCETWVTNTRNPIGESLRIKQCVRDYGHEGECEMGPWREA